MMFLGCFGLDFLMPAHKFTQTASKILDPISANIFRGYSLRA